MFFLFVSLPLSPTLLNPVGKTHSKKLKIKKINKSTFAVSWNLILKLKNLWVGERRKEQVSQQPKLL